MLNIRCSQAAKSYVYYSKSDKNIHKSVSEKEKNKKNWEKFKKPTCNFSKYGVCYRTLLKISKSNTSGGVAQSVEQRTENPCVPGSIPGLATIFFAFFLKAKKNEAALVTA